VREIKFRAWDDINEVMVIPAIIDNPFNWMNSNYDQLMQFASIKDKNGVEIYEGDIVRHRRYWDGAADLYGNTISESGFYTRIGHVTMTAGKGVVINGYQYFESDSGLSDSSRKYNENPGCWSEFSEVIGNIHENPELLEDKE
jgi:uncharacterized phage protein (TIGR01671 family)